MEQAPQIAFRRGWYSWELGYYRPCTGTYQVYPYDSLPPIPDPDPDFSWLAPVSDPPPHGADSAYQEELRQKLESLIEEAARLGLRLPDAFVRCMGSPALREEIRSGTGCWFRLSNQFVSYPGHSDGFLVGFLRDQQDCVIWCLYLLLSGETYVVAVPDDAAQILPEYSYTALLGDLSIAPALYRALLGTTPDPAKFELKGEEATVDIAPDLSHVSDVSEIPDTLSDIPPAVPTIYICAYTFESFIYRFWIEDTIAWKLGGLNSAPLTSQEQSYLDRSYVTYYAPQQGPTD